MADVRRVKLPGVGVLHTFVTDDGGKCGVITHRSGHSDLITFSDDADGADVKKVSLRLSEDEAHTLAELLGGTRITESLSALDQIPGLSIDWFTVDYDDHIAGQPLGDLGAKGVVGLTVVAVVRGDAANPAPSGDFKVFPGDTLVVAGSPEKVAKAFAWYRTGELRHRSPADAPPGS
ncbi:hypothetical protein ITJ48_12565 [Frigoribacterium sp. VKM Ac-2530]|jgi:TrkA domain protein|nr:MULTISPECIES: TrkA C-terminal domain-containing protein [unclassified Frigoribacterium]MBD8583341.1 hypothetical protein [Frigoribacterium sp. CFBP 8766]MBF4580388.1 hypothetical protein [Frigoribacterium sp. VKM Ac-2530]